MINHRELAACICIVFGYTVIFTVIGYLVFSLIGFGVIGAVIFAGIAVEATARALR